MIKIYDIVSKKIKPLIINNNNVSIYLCGPTVYNYVHLGNVRGVIVFDVLHRLLLHKKTRVNYVHNITDIDDKIIAQAQALNISEQEISDKYYQAYLQDLTTLNVLLPTSLPKVSSYISENIAFISKLIAKEYAYVIKGNVYFKVNKISDYGNLAQKNIADLIPNFRVNTAINKEYALDFVLWKATTAGVTWNSPWGKGRPGWHTECVVFIEKLFSGKTIDLHGGGIDLKFPHHENERAQFMALHNKELAHIWWHNGHISINEQKMAKSEGNFIFVKDFCQQYHPHVLRYLILNRDHHQPLAFSEEVVLQSVNAIKRYENVLKQWSYHLFINDIINNKNYDQKYYDDIIHYLENNIDTTNVITIIETMVKELNEALHHKNYDVKAQKVFVSFVFALKILGFDFTFGNYSSQIKSKIKKWEQLKQAKNYTAADEIRQQLKDSNII